MGFWSNINSVDGLLQTYLQKFKSQITPGTLPLFLVYDSYIACGQGCAIGGYHSANAGPPGGQTYSFSVTIDNNTEKSVTFAQSTGALSHEFGEWLLDPFTTNPGCGGLMENGDPLETEANYGLYPFTGKNGDPYSLQDLVFINYFGAPKNVSLDSWYTFQNETCFGTLRHAVSKHVRTSLESKARSAKSGPFFDFSRHAAAWKLAAFSRCGIRSRTRIHFLGVFMARLKAVPFQKWPATAGAASLYGVLVVRPEAASFHGCPGVRVRN